MRTNIVIDDDLMARAMAAAGTTTKKSTVEAGLEELIAKHRPPKHAALLASFGKTKPMDWGWGQTLDEMRTDPDWGLWNDEIVARRQGEIVAR